MKKVIVSLLVLVFVLGTVDVVQAQSSGRGGVMGFIAGCCFGVRAGCAYNDGKDIHWREWITLIPFVCIWNGIDGANGMTTADFVNRYGAQYY